MIARRVAASFSRPELRKALHDGLKHHRIRGRLGFLRANAREIYRIVLTNTERRIVREEVAGWHRSRRLFLAEVMEHKEVRSWSRHLNPLHFPERECEWCYALLLDNVLRKREEPKQ